MGEGDGARRGACWRFAVAELGKTEEGDCAEALGKTTMLGSVAPKKIMIGNPTSAGCPPVPVR